ncbi:MAG: radical SAM protein [Desulfobacter sp.]
MDEQTKESAVYDRRYWLKISNCCNNNCIFCLDADSVRKTAFESMDGIESRIQKAVNGGFTRLVISGGEATIHPEFIEIVQSARKRGFPKIQVVSNGRMFSYPDFTRRAVAAGLTEATISVHGHHPGLHDRLSGVAGAFGQTYKGIVQLLKTGKCIVNIDIVVNRMNYRHVEDIIRLFSRLNIFEFDLLHVIPFGAAFKNREKLFFDRQQAAPYLKKAFRYSKKPGFYIWTNRFPPGLLEGHEALIQDPHKLYDEINGRADLFEGYRHTGKLHCRSERCETCFMRPFCNKYLWYEKKRYNAAGIDTICTPKITEKLFTYLADVSPYSLETVLSRENLDKYLMQKRKASRFQRILFTMTDWKPSGLQWSKIFNDGRCAVEITGSSQNLPEIIQSGIKTVFLLNRDTRQMIMAHYDLVQRFAATISFRFPVFEKLSTARDEYEGILEFLCLFQSIPVQDCTPCLANGGFFRSRNVISPELYLDKGRMDLGGLVEEYIHRDYFIKGDRCSECIHEKNCRGMHINFIRIFGFGRLKENPRPQTVKG